MLETLIQVDQAVFVFINSTLSNPVTDFVMPLITNDWGLRGLYAVAMLLLLWKGNTRLRWLVLFSALVLALTDQIAAGYLKPLIARARPCHVLDTVNLLVGCGGGKSMPSAHSANAFGQAVLFSFHYRKVGWFLYPYAALVALSRVFVGVHYPGDILAGAILGTVIGLALTLCFRPFCARLTGIQKEE
jgi:undecaprenyl-diphosphatase